MNDSKSLRILTIDDDPATLRLLNTVVSRNGCRIRRACAASTESVEIARKFQPHLILLDITMPGMDGIDAAKALHALDLTDCMLVAFAAPAEAKYRASCEELGFDHFMMKPVSLIQLQSLIDEASERFLMLATV
jgi:CheY-like chemotaxis protein